jgi:hypothetical protein
MLQRSNIPVLCVRFISSPPNTFSTWDGFPPSGGYPDAQRRTGTPTVRGELPVRSRGEIATPESVASLYRADQGKSSRIPQVWDLPRRDHPSIRGRPRQTNGSRRQKKEAVRAGRVLSAVHAVPGLICCLPGLALCRPALATGAGPPVGPRRPPDEFGQTTSVIAGWHGQTCIGSGSPARDFALGGPFPSAARRAWGPIPRLGTRVPLIVLHRTQRAHSSCAGVWHPAIHSPELPILSVRAHQADAVGWQAERRSPQP